MQRCLNLPAGRLALPAFLPDATSGVVRAVDSQDMIHVGVQAVVMNIFHLMQRPGSSTVQALGGLHAMSGWQRPIITDSGGFQAYSMIRQNAKYGSITANGILFRPENSRKKLHLTPEKCVQLQVSYGTDVVMCLDECTHVDAPPEEQRAAVQRTIAWAQRCKMEFDRLLADKGTGADERPLIFGVIQGGSSEELRRECAEALLEIGFDGFGYGGWPLDGEGNLLAEVLAYTRSLVPTHMPLHALGVGHPVSVVACSAMGYGIFDSALPTRDARHGRLYTFHDDTLDRIPTNRSDWFSFLYVTDKKYIKDNRPVMEGCACLTCRHYSRGYLHHLFKSSDATFMRLATIHNLYFMAQLMAKLRVQEATASVSV